MVVSRTRCRKNEEVVKLVLVGDTAAGKSKLITCKVSGQPAKIKQLSQKAHIPTVWAVDQKRLYKEDIDSIRVSYTIWDTFGDHTNDRCFAYAGADAILICYSAINRRSLKNAEKFWFKEIERYNNRAAKLLVACKTDLRPLIYGIGMNGDQLWENLPTQLKFLKSDDIVLPSEGRNMAKMINAYYYETNILDRNGVDDTFINALKASLYSRRKYSPSKTAFSFWINPNAPQFPVDSIKPSIQIPLLPEKPNLHLDKYYVMPTYCKDIEMLLNDETLEHFFDCALTVKLDDGDFFDLKANQIVLSSASTYFRKIFLQKKYIRNDFVAELIVPDQNEDQISFRIILICSTIFATKLIQFIYTGHLLLDFEGSEKFASLVKSLDVCLTASDLNFLEIDQEKFRTNLLQSGMNNRTCELVVDIICENEQRFRVYKPILMVRCEAINVMMKNEFLEKKKNQINLFDISATVLEMFLSYCFTDKIDQLVDVSELEICDFLEALELASRFCLGSFAQLIQTALIDRLTLLPDQECCVIIASQIIGPAKLFNFKCLLHWCLIYLCCHERQYTWVDILDQETADFIDIHCWPPKWYFDELRIYDLEVENLEKHLEKRRTKTFLRQNNGKSCSKFGQFLFNFVHFGK